MTTFRRFVRDHVARLQSLETQASLAWWEAATTGDGAAYRREAQLKTEVETLLADRESFAFLEAARESNAAGGDPLDRRLSDVLYLAHLGRQCSADLLGEIVHLSSELEEIFATFRVELGGAKLTRNDIEETLTRSNDTEHRRKVWEASKQIGPMVAPKVLELVALRNRAARELGREDYYRLSLELAEQNAEDVAALFDELDRRTARAYRATKRVLDARLGERFGLEPGDLRSWHYPDPFFQEPSEPSELRLDDIYEGRDLLEIATEFFRGIGLKVDAILARSDVHERNGKNQHAFCIDIDRAGDVRVLLNLATTARWMSTVLHELGHAVYDCGIRGDLPYPLRRPAHTFVTEGVAMLFGRMPYTASWLTGMGLVEDSAGTLATTLSSHQAHRQLVFSRWCQVMVRFESTLYADPGADLDTLWWRLVERYQEVPRPDGHAGEDWATKSHIVATPVYYHNYLIGEVFASQLLDALLVRLGDTVGDEGSILGRREAADFLLDRVFSPGASLPWPRFVEEATGRPLSVEAFVRRFAAGSGH